jgi:hypothetical protein
VAKAKQARPPGPKRYRGKIHFLHSIILRDGWCRYGYSLREDELTREPGEVTCKSCQRSMKRAGRV